LQQHPGWLIGDFAARFRRRFPASDGLDLLSIDRCAVFMAEQVLQQDAYAEGQSIYVSQAGRLAGLETEEIHGRGTPGPEAVGMSCHLFFDLGLASGIEDAIQFSMGQYVLFARDLSYRSSLVAGSFRDSGRTFISDVRR